MRRVIIMSGVSGSGKSSYISNVIVPEIQRNMSFLVLSADDFFIYPDDGSYVFKPKLLGKAHAFCFRNFIRALQSEIDVVVVDNTNTTAVEIAPYVLAAEAFHYEAEIITLMCEDDFVETCAARNAHGVSPAGVQAQHQRLKERCLMSWWKYTFKEVS